MAEPFPSLWKALGLIPNTSVLASILLIPSVRYNPPNSTHFLSLAKAEISPDAVHHLISNAGDPQALCHHERTHIVEACSAELVR